MLVTFIQEHVPTRIYKNKIKWKLRIKVIIRNESHAPIPVFWFTRRVAPFLGH